jgi:hypothetical protein
MTDDRLDRCSIYAHRFGMLASIFRGKWGQPTDWLLKTQTPNQNSSVVPI